MFFVILILANVSFYEKPKVVSKMANVKFYTLHVTHVKLRPLSARQYSKTTRAHFTERSEIQSHKPRVFQ